MSDSNPTPPPRPKPGSLRDRIAAFERPAQAAQVPAPPPPRPKPVGVQWRPKQQQQQQQQQQQTEDGDGQDQSTQSSAEGVPPSTAGVNSMSASDARNSIKQGGSLKERMAALQGRGAFGGLGGGGSGGGGASAPKETSPPPPPTQKPKWKPPPQVSFIPAEGEESPAPARESVEEDKDKREEVQTETEENPAQDQEQQEQVDPEEEERQRRATIAARMAKLGGARVGMAPPGMFGGARPPPPVAKKPEALRVPTAKESEAQAGTLPLSPPPPPSTVPGAEEVEEESLLVAEPEPGPGTGTGSDAGSPTPSHSRSPPPSMPAPAVPRRTAPPRRKPPKSPVPPPPEVEPEASLIEAESVPLATQVTEEHLEVLTDLEPFTKEERREFEVQSVEEVETMQDLVGDDAHDDTAREVAVVEEPEQQQPEEEEEEEDVETRRKRIAERIAKMGAINPLAPPPISRGSVSDEVEVGSPPASASVRRSSIDSVSSVKSGGLAKRSSIGSVASPPVSATAIRRSSIDSISSLKSVSSPTGIAVPARKASVDSVKEAESAAVKGAAVVGGIPEQDEREEVVDENVPEEEQIQEEEEEGSNDALAASMILERPPPPDVIEQEAHETVPVPAPPVDRSSRPSSDDPQTGTRPSVHQRRSSGYVTRPPQNDDSREHDNRGSIEQTTDIGHDESGRASPPPLPISPRTGAFVPASLRTRRFAHDEDEDDEEEEEEEVEELRPLPVPHRTSSVLSSRHALKKEPDVYEEDRQEDQEQEEDQVKHVPPPPTRKVPLPPPSVTPAQAESESPVISTDSTPAPYSAPVEQEQQEALEPGSAHSDAPLVIPPPASERRLSKSAASDRPLPHPMSFRQSKPQVEVPQLEIMDDEEGDPIDPSIHVPRRSPGRSSQVAVPAPPPPPAFAFKVDPQEEEADPNAIDMDAARRSTIAERMARLGGIKFGAAPPVPVARLSSVPTEEAGEAEGYEERKEEVGEGESVGEEKKEVDEEEEERARKERIAAKLAGMGGMRIGMMPATMGFPPRPPQRSAPPPQVKEEATPVPPPPPPVAPRARPPPPPQPQEAEWERDSASNSEDGVKVDMEESDMEEVNYEDARTDEDHKDHEDGEMVAPPPPPRVHSRPPVPSTSNIRSSTLGRKSSSGSTTTTKTASTSPQRTRGNYDFVMVDEPQDAGEEEELEGVPPPPARPLQRRLTREAPSHPPPHPPQQSMSDSISSQWELPVIPSGGLGLGADLSMSWTETDELAATLIPPTHAPPPPPSIDAHSAMHPTTGQRLSSDELNAVWKRVGVQVCEAAMQLYEKSKKTVVGDGTYAGFVHAVLNEVPNATKPPVEGHHEWGYLVYAQTGSAVQKRLSEIMSGDVVEFIDARFKGHKSPLQTYSQHVGGAGEPVVGVVASEVEPKKTKVKVVQANQHVGQQTVESVSYRLEDLKSGTVKVYRILEA